VTEISDRYKNITAATDQYICNSSVDICKCCFLNSTLANEQVNFWCKIRERKMDVDPIFVQMSTDTATFLIISFALKLRHWNRNLHRASFGVQH
jgi:hypothetical protein